MSRIYSINETYIKTIDENELFKYFKEYVLNYQKPFDQSKGITILKSLGFLKNKAKTLHDIWKNSQYIISNKINIGSEEKKLINQLSTKIIGDFISQYEKLGKPTRENLELIIKSLINNHKTNFKNVGQPLRIGLIGSKFGPGIYDIILSLDKDEVIKRLKDLL